MNCIMIDGIGGIVEFHDCIIPEYPQYNGVTVTFTNSRPRPRWLRNDEHANRGRIFMKADEAKFKKWELISRGFRLYTPGS